MPELIIVSLYPAYLDCAHISKHPPGGKGLIYNRIGGLKICVFDILTLHTYWQNHFNTTHREISPIQLLIDGSIDSE